MPKRETRRSIEAELNADEQRLFAERLEATMRDFEELECRVQELEKACGISGSRDQPLDERLEAVGLNRAAAAAREALEVMTKATLGEIDEIPERLKHELAERADAEISALDQLQAIVDAVGANRQRR
ncbi:MAG: hypothetical protein JOY90_12515 [Bradyrhizobium sp.]|uniref:hypothetical protein n=1 Tax=Bradyrhizobium sp. TaxID=376 RepID=UPI001D62D596|nr:hypothetical protein [Bradyrhizobium sp.]MBV9561260.1 hypothetical protein [Bradyrhizobium sp.]